MVSTPLNELHPRLQAWLQQAFQGRLTEAQEKTLPAILAGRSVLLSSPTGSGKTLAGFLGVLDHLLRLHDAGELGRDRIHAVYVSPLRALTYDIHKNLTRPLQEMGLAEIIRIGSRTGDTTASDRAKLRRSPPHILLTTPESLAILLPQPPWRAALAACRFVIIDELHALAENKRGAHLTLSLERLQHGLAGPLVRIGLSATASPLPRLANLLCGGEGDPWHGRPCDIVESREARLRRVEVLSPLKKDPYPPAGYTAARVLSDIAALVSRKRSVIVFCNTRSATESIALRLKQALPKLADRIEAHHASLDRDVRLEVEDRLKQGELRAVVCSTSLELGVDIGAVDCVVMISTPKGINRALQRIGRSGHSIHESSHGVLVATNVNDLMECVVCAEMTRAARLDDARLPECPLDVLAQHLVGLAAEGGFSANAAFALVRQARPFTTLTRAEFDRVLRYLQGGGQSLEKQYAEHFGKIIEMDGLLTLPSARVRREYLANVGVIHTEGMVSVLLGRRRLGQVEESFLKRLRRGDVFVLAGRTVRLMESGLGEARVEEARHALPTVPAWNASKMPLSSGLAREVRAFRTELARRVPTASPSAETTQENLDWLVERFEISPTNAEAILRHARHQRLASLIPTAETFLIERYEAPPEKPDSGEGLLHFFFHSLIGRAANDALSRILAWRVRQSVGGNALVTIDDYGFLLTLRPFQDLELEAWQELFSADQAESDLRAALDDSELVKWCFRGVAQTGLMVPRQQPGREVKSRQLRWNAEVLWQVLKQHEPDHPLIEQSRREATHSFLDLPAAIAFLQSAPTLRWHLQPVPVVSPFAFPIYASKIKEGMMLEDPEEAIERLWRAFRDGFPDAG